MKAKIAVVTVSGKAYYLIVNELKKKGIDFLSLTPHETVPLDTEVVITTVAERDLIKHPKVLVYSEEEDPAGVVNEAIRTLHGKERHETIVIGIDPGKTFGLAVLSDGKVLDTATCTSIQETLSITIDYLKKLPASSQIVRVGNGAPTVTAELLPLLDEALPKEVVIEVVSEAGTSHFVGETLHKRGLRDALSAVKIAERRGQPCQRGKERKA